jgi:hypothetical protein
LDRLLLITVRDGARLRAVLPLLEEKPRLSGIPFRRLRSAANLDHSCRFDIIHGDGPGIDEIARVVWDKLKSLPAWDAIELTNIPEGAAAEGLLPMARQEGCLTAQREHVRTPYIILDGFRPDGDVYQFARGAKLRNNLRKGWRRIQEIGPVRLRRVETAEPEALEQFYRLEQSGWKGRKGTAVACSKETRRFYDLIARSAAEFGYFSLYFLEVSDSTIAADMGFHLAGRYYPIKIAYDETFRAYGPGHLLVSAILQDVVRQGVSKYDWLGHIEDWKAQWTSETRLHGFCYIFRNSLIGRALHADTVLRNALWTAARKVGRPLLETIRFRKARLKSWSA